MDILAIDPSLRRVGIYSSKTDKTYKIETKTAGEGEALDIIYSRITKGIKNTGPYIIVYEGNSCFGSLGYGASSLFAVIGIIRMIAAQQNLPIFEMPVITWKTYIFGKARKEWPTKGNKARHFTEEYLRVVKIATGRIFETTDEADAYMIYKTFTEKGVPEKKKKFKKQRKRAIITAQESDESCPFLKTKIKLKDSCTLFRRGMNQAAGITSPRTKSWHKPGTQGREPATDPQQRTVLPGNYRPGFY